MKSPCDICVEKCQSPGGPGTCNCTTCDKQAACYRSLRPTVRITSRCTQACQHCCYECSPQRDDFMSLEVAADVALFCQANGIERLNIMGGEFYCHPQWNHVLRALAGAVCRVRLVTNGDWAAGGAEPPVIPVLQELGEKVRVCISQDRWHTNRWVEEAAQLCEEAGVRWEIATEELANAPEVPVGRHRFEIGGMHAMFGRWCSSKPRRYHFLIDERGEIAKCPFGPWTYASVQEYTEGGFRARFKHFTSTFYSAWIPNCRACNRAWESELLRERREKAEAEAEVGQ
jgi:MoaA/NifB/PqqE/SkfB family radical SAM enzyme